MVFIQKTSQEQEFESPNEGIQEDKNNIKETNFNKDIISKLQIYGFPYIVKFLMLLGISISIILFSSDLFSKSISVTAFIATLTIDMWVVQQQSKFITYYNRLKSLQFGYSIVLILVLIICIIITIFCALHNQPIKGFNCISKILSLFLIPLGMFSPVFEICYSINNNDD